MGIISQATVEGFFHECVTEAMENRDVDASEHTAFYLVGLLGELTRGRLSDEPLALKLAKSKVATPDERIRELKEVGDHSLVLAGLFFESLERRLVDPDYYIGIGEAAYGELAGRLPASAVFAEIYDELAAKFARFVEVLQDVKTRVHFCGNDLISMYEQWRQTGSEPLGRRLRAAGVLLPDEDEVH